MHASPVWVPRDGDKQWYVPMASIESTSGRKLKDTSFVGCVFRCCHNTSLLNHWVSPLVFRLIPMLPWDFNQGYLSSLDLEGWEWPLVCQV